MAWIVIFSLKWKRLEQKTAIGREIKFGFNILIFKSLQEIQVNMAIENTKYIQGYPQSEEIQSKKENQRIELWEIEKYKGKAKEEITIKGPRKAIFRCGYKS